MSIGLAYRSSEHTAEQGKSLTAGVLIGIVTNNKDTEGLGRVKVRFPSLPELNESFWARVASPMAGNNRGVFFLPEKDDEVLVMFAHGDVRFPYVIGSLWNGKDKAPADNSNGENNVRMIKSRNGAVITLNDKKGNETVEIIDASGNNKIVIDTKTNHITITADGNIELSAPEGTIKLGAKKIEIAATESGTITAGTSMTVEAKAKLTVVGQPVNIN